MLIFFLILIALASVILGFIILVQNPKGGGLAGNVAGFSNQFMGVKQTTDVLEKGTWIFAILIALLCLFSSFFIRPASGRNFNVKPTTNQSMPLPNQGPGLPTTTPVQQQPK